MRQLPINGGEYAQIDDQDFMACLGRMPWFFDGSGYVHCYTKGNERAHGKYIYLHRFIAERAGLDCTNMIDHKDRDIRNNQRDNLRSATRSQNNANSKLRSNNSSGVKGVSWDSHREKWRAEIRVRNQRFHLGYFDCIKAGETAYLAARKRYFGEFA